MASINFLFCLLALYFMTEVDKPWLFWLNMLSFILNGFVVIASLI